MTTVIDPFWVDNPYILIQSNRMLEFFITDDMSLEEKLNSIVRFGIYVSVILAMYHKRYKYLMLVLPIMLITYIVFFNYTPKDMDNFETEKVKYTLPTINNPFGNSSIVDITDNPDRPPMIDYSTNTEESLKIKKDIEKKFNYNLYKDLGDVYGKENSQRQFYTAPNRGNIPNDPNGEFKQWLYGGKKSCKEGHCPPYEDVRRKTRIGREKY